VSPYYNVYLKLFDKLSPTLDGLPIGYGLKMNLQHARISKSLLSVSPTIINMIKVDFFWQKDSTLGLIPLAVNFFLGKHNINPKKTSFRKIEGAPYLK
jgi:hypothetical protein